MKKGKIKKDVIYAEKTFLSEIYIPQITPPYFNEEIFSTIGEEISHFQARGSVLITGDLKARTDEEPDF